MHISRLVVRNFRNFQLFDCPLQSGVTCVLGENNAGKSNLLYALRLALDINLPSNLRQLTETDVHCCTSINVAQQVLISVEFTAYTDSPEQCAMCGLWEIENNRARVTYRFRPRQAVREAIARTEKAPDSLTIEDYVWELTGGTSDANGDPSLVAWDQPCGQAIKFQELQAFKIDFLPALRDVESDLRHSRLSPLSRLLAVLDIPQAEKDALVETIRDANDQIETSPTIHTAGEAANAAFADTAGEAFKMQLRLGMIAPTFYSISRNLTVLLTNGPVVDFEPSRNGLGLNNVLYLSMLLEYFRRRISRPETAGQLLLIEEPEAHLHPQLQHILFSKLRANSFQSILTTHSTHISSAAPLTSLIFLTNIGAGATAGTVTSKIPNLSMDESADLERYLDATRSNLLFARKVMLVEGPAESFLIPPLVKKVMNIDLERQGISVIPIHGVHFAAYAKLFSEEGMRKKCALVTDGDLSPSDSTPEGTDDEDVDDMPTTRRCDDLLEFENEFLKVFSCETTFERTLAIPGLLHMLSEACQELGAPRVKGKFDDAIFELTLADNAAETSYVLEGLDSSVLNTAKRFGKARFAQVASKYVQSATALPDYIEEAVNWLMEE